MGDNDIRVRNGSIDPTQFEQPNPVAKPGINLKQALISKIAIAILNQSTTLEPPSQGHQNLLAPEMTQNQIKFQKVSEETKVKILSLVDPFSDNANLTNRLTTLFSLMVDPSHNPASQLFRRHISGRAEFLNRNDPNHILEVLQHNANNSDHLFGYHSPEEGLQLIGGPKANVQVGQPMAVHHPDGRVENHLVAGVVTMSDEEQEALRHLLASSALLALLTEGHQAKPVTISIHHDARPTPPPPATSRPNVSLEDAGSATAIKVQPKEVRRERGSKTVDDKEANRLKAQQDKQKEIGRENQAKFKKQFKEEKVEKHQKRDDFDIERRRENF